MNDASPPLVERGRSMLDQLLSLAQNRLEMVSVEIQREKLELARSFQITMALVVSGWLGGFALILCAALALPERLRLPWLAGLAIAFLVASLVCWLVLRRRATRQALFTRVIRQLELDRAALKREP